VIFVNDKLESVTKNSRKFAPEEAQELAAEERDGRCPVCGQEREEITVGTWGWGE